MTLIKNLHVAAHTISSRIPVNVAKIQVYGEARGGYSKRPFPFMGMRNVIKDYLETPITPFDIDEALKYYPDLDVEMWTHIIENHNGYLPIKIEGIKEGQRCYPGDVLWTIESLDDKCAMLPHMMDKMIVSHIWSQSTICQKLHRLFDLLANYCEQAGLPREVCEDLAGGATQFGPTSMTNMANALIGLYFPHSINVGAAEYLSHYYGVNRQVDTAQISDHSSILLWEDEQESFSALLKTYHDKWCSMLVDTVDYTHFFETILPQFKDEIVQREQLVSLALDSSDHFLALDYALHMLEQIFGSVCDEHDFRLIDAPIGITQLEDIDFDAIQASISLMYEERWSPTNFYWHISDHFIQEGLSRSTNGFVQKVCYVERTDGSAQDICKRPMNDLKKTTKKGRQSIENGHTYYDAGVIQLDSFDQVRERLVK